MTDAANGPTAGLDRTREPSPVGSTTTTARGRRLIPTTVVAGVLMVIAAVNEALMYVLSSRGLGDVVSFLPIMAIGAFPFLFAAGLLALVVTRSSRAPRDLAIGILVVAAVLLPFMVVCSFWAAFAASFLAGPGTPTAYALAAFQFTFAAAVVADVVTIIVAWRARK